MSDHPIPLSKALRREPATRMQIEELGDRLQDVEAKMDQLGEKVGALTELITVIQHQILSRQFGTNVASAPSD